MRFRRRVGLQIAWMLAVIGCWSIAAAVVARIVPRLGTVIPIISGFVLMMVAFGAGKAVRRLARPIELLTEASRRFGSGDLATRVELPPLWEHIRIHRLRHHHHHGRGRGLDEIIELRDAWNDMAERIETLVRGQRELLANVSHELRSPLARIRLALELLPRTADTEPRFTAVVADIEELDGLIDDVLTAARLDGGAFPLHTEEVALADLFASVATRAAHDPQTSGLELRVLGDGLSAKADPALLRRALWNLVENAAKYGAPPVVLSAEQRGDHVALTVTDAGPGIRVEDRTRVIEPFVRLDEARTPGAKNGVGLGLTIAARVAAAHGGTLTLEPGPDGQGLRAVLTIAA